MKKNVIIVGNVSESWFTYDLAESFGQKRDVSDIISLKNYSNTEFCPRFILNEEDFDHIGDGLKDSIVIITSVQSDINRNELAMRNFVMARTAKDNGAEAVILVEPDLFYSAQDRGPRPDHGTTLFERQNADFFKFNGQPFTARLYAQLLKSSGVDAVYTIHNHSHSTQVEFSNIFGENNFINLFPDELYASYITKTGLVDPKKLVFVAPDKGAAPFVEHVAEKMKADIPVVIMDKVRHGEREVSMTVSKASPYPLEIVSDKHVIIFDDMVRTGSTIVSCCEEIQSKKPINVIFMTTHFHTSPETRTKLGASVIDEIITTNTIPTILNRDNQGRLRKKMAVLKIGKWIVSQISEILDLGIRVKKPYYDENISDKNPRSPNYFKNED